LISTSGSGSAQAGTPTQAVEQLSTKPEESSLNPEAGFITMTNTTGDVHIVKVDSEGKFVRVMNMGDKVIKLLLKKNFSVILDKKFIFYRWCLLMDGS